MKNLEKVYAELKLECDENRQRIEKLEKDYIGATIKLMKYIEELREAEKTNNEKWCEVSKDYGNIIKRLENLENNHDRFIEEFYNQEYKQIETSLKALEIIKKKKVQVKFLLLCENIDKYNCCSDSKDQLTQEEFEIVKKELEK